MPINASNYDGSEVYNIAELSDINNENILINGDFQVWQRGTYFPTSESGQYTADRWRTFVESGTLNISNSSGRMLVQGNGKRYAISQYLEMTDSIKNKLKLVGKLGVSALYITNANMNIGLSVTFMNGGGDSKTMYSKVVQAQNGVSSRIEATFDMTTEDINNYSYIQFNVASITAEDSTNSLYIYYGKLEYGEVTPYYPKPYSREYLDCCAYFLKRSVIRCVKLVDSNTQFYTPINGTFPVEMIGTPSIAYGSITNGIDSNLGVTADFSGRVEKSQISSVKLSSAKYEAIVNIKNVSIDAELVLS